IRADMVVSSEVHFRTTDKHGTLRCIDIGWGGADGADPWQIHSEREEKPETYLLALGRVATPAVQNDVVPVAPTTPLRGGKSFILSQYPLAHLGAVDQLGLH